MEHSKPNSDVVASLAVPVDGYIARPDGSVDFLEKYPIEDFDFDSWLEGVGALIMRRVGDLLSAGDPCITP